MTTNTSGLWYFDGHSQGDFERQWESEFSICLFYDAMNQQRIARVEYERLEPSQCEHGDIVVTKIWCPAYENEMVTKEEMIEGIRYHLEEEHPKHSVNFLQQVIKDL